MIRGGKNCEGSQVVLRAQEISVTQGHGAPPWARRRRRRSREAA